VIRDGVWIGNWIYWTLTLVTINNYDSLTELHTPKITVSTAHIVFFSLHWPLLGSGFQRPTFPFLWVPELYPASATSFSLLTTAEQSSSLLPATSQHGHSWHRAPLGHMAIYLFCVKTFVFFFFFFRCSSSDKREGLGFFFVIGVPLLHLFHPRSH
jgi:hypothetical protein